VDQAQAAYDRAGGASNPFIAMTPAALQLQTATLDYQAAKANYDKAAKPDASALASAETALVQAKAALDLKKQGPRAEDIAIAQVRVEQAQTALEQAQAAIPKTRLFAPFDGTITDLPIRAGDVIQAGAPVLTLADLAQLRVETTDLDEWGAAKVKIGQAAKIVVNAFADKTLTGKVSNIALQSVTLPTGDVSYVVTLTLDQQDPELRWGMTVKVEFQNK
jgi:HlyD family secretion protein